MTDLIPTRVHNFCQFTLLFFIPLFVPANLSDPKVTIGFWNLTAL